MTISPRQRQAAKKFVEYWTFRRGSEKGEDQQFWNMLLRDVLGMENVEQRTQPQVPVQMKGTVKFLDLWIPETKVLVEHKSRGIKLDAPQSGHGGKTPFEQAVEYNQARGYSDKARWIITCNFDEIWVYDMDKPLADPQKIALGNLPKEVARLGFLVDSSVKSVREQEKEISIQAGRIVGELYKELLKRYDDGALLSLRGDSESRSSGEDSKELPNSKTPSSESNHLAALNRLCVRLAFLFYAEDAELFPKDAFWNFLKETPAKFLRGQLQKLFRVLDTPDGSNGTKNERDPYLEPEIAAFPYTNGGLFKGVDEAEIPPLDDEIKELLIRSANFDWRDISPTIFGALFESTLNPVTRRAGGMVYTSVENIHKVIDPLFLDELAHRVDEATKGTEGTKGTLSAKSRSSLLSLQSLLSSLKFLDPACGSGNFLTETFLSLRRLENRIIAALQRGQGELDLGLTAKVSIAQFHGIEINDFAVAVAKAAMWISEAKMLQETAKILHREPDYLPLKDYDGVVEDNALRMDWPRADYIMGNPPFIGARNKSKEQAADMETVFGADWKGLGNLDYVTAWYKKAAAFDSRCAFVSTNSICQGDGVAALWKPLFAQGLEIDFAHRTFRWDSEATEKAHVHCVIVGFHVGGQGTKGTEETKGTRGSSSLESLSSLKSLGCPKTIFDGDRATPAAHINGYLMDAPDAWVESRTKPLCDVPEMGIGNKPIDGGSYLFAEEEKQAFLKKEPKAAPYFHLWYGAYEFIHSEPRWCLWLGDCTPHELHEMPECLKRVAAVRDFRLASKSEGTRKIAERPTRFHVENMPNDNYLLVPSVSSERREYVPIGFMDANTIASNLVLILPSATLYHFGILTSSAHMAWMRAVAGRLKSDYRYSANIVYNNFPWPDLVVSGQSLVVDEEKKRQLTTNHYQLITQTAQAILDARAAHTDCSLADLYDPLTMPPDLRAAHAANDRAVLAAYGLAPDTPEPAIVAHLFKLYAEMSKKGSSNVEAAD